MKVWLVKYGFWADVISEDDETIVARDLDGIMTYVVKDGTQQVMGDDK